MPHISTTIKILLINIILFNLAFKAISSIDDEFVIGLYLEDIGAYAFPIYIMDHHEVVNVKFNNTSLSITWSPHSSTNRVFNMTKELRPKTLGISKFFYQNNLVLYDRATFTMWSQIKGIGLTGPLMGHSLEQIDSIFTKWKTWKSLYPNTLVLDKPSKQLKKYYEDRYVNYRKQSKPRHQSCYTDNYKVFPFNLKPSKELTFVLELGTSYFLIPQSESKLLLESSYNGYHFLFIFHEKEFYFKAFSRYLEGNVLNFKIIKDDDPIREELNLENTYTVFKDSSNSVWNSSGHCIFGVHEGKILDELPSFQMFWYSAISFYSISPIWYNSSIVISDNEELCKEDPQLECIVNCDNMISRWISNDVLLPVDNPVFITSKEFEEEGLIPWNIIMAYIIIISILIALFFSLLIHYFINKRRESHTLMSVYDSDDDLNPGESTLEKKVTFDLDNSEVIQLSRTSLSNDVVMVDMSQNKQTSEDYTSSSSEPDEESNIKEEDEENKDNEEEEEEEENKDNEEVEKEEDEEDEEELAKILSPSALKHIKDGLNRI